MNRLLIESARRHIGRTAIVENGNKFTYGNLLQRSNQIKSNLERLGVKRGERVAIWGEKSFNFCATQLAVWQLGGISVMLLPSYPVPELQYFLRDSGAKLIISSDVQKAKECSNSVQVVNPSSLLLGDTNKSDTEAQVLDCVRDTDPACLIYTSGSTGSPKGVVTTHASLRAMISGMQERWEWTESDHILHFLPLHHVHGFVNKLLTPLATGAKVEFVDFAPRKIWDRLQSPNDSPTVFMGVPTIYSKLMNEIPSNFHKPKQVRLFVSGSAPLPIHLFNGWEQLTGHRILERWGMTEVGMGLSNPLRPVEQRLPGYVGLPMPGIEVKVCDLPALEELPSGTPGDLLVRGSTVFTQYWNSNKALEEFTSDGYFKTGDVALFDANVNSYKIVGRKSVDVIKSGGFKISALEIEQMLMSFPGMKEVAVLGLPDEIWGEAVAAIVVLSSPASAKEIQDFAAKYMAKYKVPKRIVFVDGEIPKNAMGKVNKKSLRALFG